RPADDVRGSTWQGQAVLCPDLLSVPAGTHPPSGRRATGRGVRAPGHAGRRARCADLPARQAAVRRSGRGDRRGAVRGARLAGVRAGGTDAVRRGCLLPRDRRGAAGAPGRAGATALLLWWELRALGWPRGRALGGVAALLSVLGLGLALVLARNLVVASTPTFIPTSLGNNLVKLHKPSDAVDLSATNSPLYDALGLDRGTREVLEFIRQDFPGYVRSLVPQALYAA